MLDETTYWVQLIGRDSEGKFRRLVTEEQTPTAEAARLACTQLRAQIHQVMAGEYIVNPVSKHTEMRPTTITTLLSSV